MTKTVKRNLILTLLLVLFGAISVFCVMQPRSAGAAETIGTIAVSETAEEDLPDDLRPLKVGDDLTGKHLYIHREWHTAPYPDNSINLLHFDFGNVSFYLEESLTLNGGSILLGEIKVSGSTLSGTGNKYYSAFFDSFTVNMLLEDIYLDNYTGGEDPEITHYTETDWVRVSAAEMGDTSDDGSGGNIGEWLDNAGTAVSDWLKSNTGIAVSSTGVILIALVIIVLFIGRRK